MSHNCAEFEPDLSALLDGELSEARTAELEAHVAACASCKAARGRLARVSSTLRRWDAAETQYASSPAFRNRVLRNLELSSAPGSDVAAAPLVRLPVPAWHRAAAAAVLLVGAGLATALVVPALRDGPPATTTHPRRVALVADARLSDLTERANQVSRMSTGSASGGRAAAADGPTLTGPILTGPLLTKPWRAIVSEPRELVAAQREEEPSGLGESGWERHGDFRLHADAVRDYNVFNAERMALMVKEFEEQVRGRSGVPDSATADGGESREVSPLGAYLANASVAAERLPSHAQIQVWPIRVEGGGHDGPRPLLVEEALREDILRARQTSSRDTPQTVQIENTDASRSILVLAGDVFQGGNQDFVVASDTLIAPGRRVTVSSRPSGKRRKTRSTKFRRSGGVAPLRLRQLLAGDPVDAESWDFAVKESLAGLASTSSGSLASVFLNDQLVRAVDRQAELFTARLDGSDVVGFAVAAGSELLGVEVFGHHEAFLSARTRLLRSYLLEARLRNLDGSLPGRDDVVSLLADARSSRAVHWSSGGGELATFTSVESGVHGFGILDGGRTLHASIFPPRGPGVGAGGPGRGRTGVEGGVDLGGDSGSGDGPSKGPAEPTRPGLEGR